MKFFYYLWKFAMVAMYISVFVYSFHYNLSPLIALYGGWAWLGTNILIFIAGFIPGFLFWAVRKPTDPQATYRPKTGVTS